MGKTWKIAGICFDHMHMPDLLRMVAATPNAELVAICDEHPERMEPISEELSIAGDQRFTDFRECLDVAQPDLVILCAATARHGEWTEAIAPYGVHILVEKPFAASLAEADRMIASMNSSGNELIINWPQRWSPPYVTVKRLIDDGTIGEVTEVHYCSGNRGPVHMVADTIGMSEVELRDAKADSWFYQRNAGGGSLLDYLGYGTTLGAWYMDGRKPLEVMCMVDRPAGLDVDEHSLTVCRYETGLSKFETRWGTFTNPWDTQPQPKCGYVLVGSEGTISAYSGDPVVSVQTRTRPEIHQIPVDSLEPPERNPIEYTLGRLTAGKSVDGPLSPVISRIGQQIVDSALRSVELNRPVLLEN